MAKPKPQRPRTGFGALLSEVRIETPESLGGEPPESLNVQTPKSLAKSQRKDFIKLTAYVPRDLHRQLKVELTKRGREISDVIEELVQEYLNK